MAKLESKNWLRRYQAYLTKLQSMQIQSFSFMLSLAWMQTSLQREQLTYVLPPSTPHITHTRTHTHSVPLANTFWFLKSPWRCTHQRLPLARVTWSDHSKWSPVSLNKLLDSKRWLCRSPVSPQPGARRGGEGCRSISFFSLTHLQWCNFLHHSWGSCTPASSKHGAHPSTPSSPHPSLFASSGHH